MLILLPESLVNADDTDFASFVKKYLGKLITVLILLIKDEFMLIFHAKNIENRLVGHSDMDAYQNAFRNTRKNTGLC